jgi:molybdopterin biosynthesis enzyme MoaB
VTFRNLVDISDVSAESTAPVHISDFEGFSEGRQVSTKQHGDTIQRKVAAVVTSTMITLIW